MPGWTDQALCATAVAQGWAVSDDWYDGDVNHAKRICATCPVAAECYSYAETLPTYEQNFGVWGGVSARARRERRTWAICVRCGDRIPKRAKLCDPCRPLRQQEHRDAYERRRLRTVRA